jgi:cytochrome bd-type quinol oxidase subunit 2
VDETPLHIPSPRGTLARIASGMVLADVMILVVGLLLTARLDPCHYAGEGTTTAILITMMSVILVANFAVAWLAHRSTRSWAMTSMILCVQLSTSVGVAFLPFVARLGPAACGA